MARRVNDAAPIFVSRHFLLCRGAIWRERFCHLIVRLEAHFNQQSGGSHLNTGIGAAKILRVEPDVAVLETRCAVLNVSGYNAAPASSHLAEIVLRSQKFDLIVLSALGDSDLLRIINFADGAEVLVLEGLTLPSELLFLVSHRLNRRQRRA
jgi:hypothetical protein